MPRFCICLSNFFSLSGIQFHFPIGSYFSPTNWHQRPWTFKPNFTWQLRSQIHELSQQYISSSQRHSGFQHSSCLKMATKPSTWRSPPSFPPPLSPMPRLCSFPCHHPHCLRRHFLCAGRLKPCRPSLLTAGSLIYMQWYPRRLGRHWKRGLQRLVQQIWQIHL